LLLKKAEAGVYQTTNAQGQNLTHLFAKNASRIGEDLFHKILGKLETKHLDFGSADNAGRTSLHYAAEAGSVKLATWLLERGLNVNAADAEDVTPLGHVLKSSFGKTVEFARASIESGLDLNKRLRDGKKEHTALTYIVAHDKNFDTFVTLHELGADINLGDSDGWTPLIHLIRQNKFAKIQSLLTTFQVDTRVVDKEGRTIIHHAVQQREFGSYENVDMLEYLVKLADINKPDKHGHTPLYYAKRQLSGRLAAVLSKHRAKDLDMSETVRRVQTSILNEIDFPTRRFNFEEDFERFVEQCRQDAENKRMKLDERVKVDPQATGNYEVVYDGNDPYDCYMIKVDISHGYYSGNTFYKMQILREKVRDVYVVFTRWGRVGTPGQYQQTPFSTVEEASKEFCSIFKSKSGNLWEDRHNFVKNNKKYRLVPVVVRNKFEDYVKAFNHQDPRLPKTELSKELYSLIRRLCNYKIIVNTLKTRFQFNSAEVPIHSLTRERVSDAQGVLDAISKALKAYEEARNKKQFEEIYEYAEELTKLTSEFYELIPNANYKSESIPPITSNYQLQNLQRLMADLTYLEVVIKLIGAATYNVPRVNPVDYCFDCLGMKVMVLDRSTEEFKLLKKYVRRGELHQPGQKTSISNIFAIERVGERDGIRNWDQIGNHMLLWHGTKPENVVGILQTGFRIAPACAESTGAMFGEGIYFTDVFSKGYNYTSGSFHHHNLGRNSQKKMKPPKKYMFLCEVALGKSNTFYNSKEVTDLPNSKFHSVKGVGREGPDPAGNVYLPSGCIVPLGKSIRTPEPKLPQGEWWGLNYNEYVVYDTTQVRIRYLLELR
jgi:ankyrin repeat protein/predicted DNA-binding WGR domain protein